MPAVLSDAMPLLSPRPRPTPAPTCNHYILLGWGQTGAPPGDPQTSDPVITTNHYLEARVKLKGQGLGDLIEFPFASIIIVVSFQ